MTDSRTSSPNDGVRFIQTWQMPDAQHVAEWLHTMHQRVHVLTGLPGFRSMSLHRGLDGPTVAVYAHWDTVDHLRAGRDYPPARAAHDELLRWGRDTGQAYALERTYLPARDP